MRSCFSCIKSTPSALFLYFVFWACSSPEEVTISDRFNEQLTRYSAQVLKETSELYNVEITTPSVVDVQSQFYLYSNRNCDINFIENCDDAWSSSKENLSIQFTNFDKKKKYYFHVLSRYNAQTYPYIYRMDWDNFAVHWKEENSKATWSKRQDHIALTFKNKIWVLGGYNGTNNLNDVWSSSDGINWTEETPSADWSPRRGHSGVVFNEKIWIFGGLEDTNGIALNEVWSSANGINWQRSEPAKEIWSPRFQHTTVVFQNKIWVLGGAYGGAKNDVWSTEDGKNWIKIKNNAPWAARSSHASVVFNDKIWVVGGLAEKLKNDVWSSKNGITWEELNKSTPWTARANHNVLVLHDHLWITGGKDSSYPNENNDLWHTKDGKTWKEIPETAVWAPRERQESVVFNEKIWVLAGYDNSARLNDIWSSPIFFTRFNFKK